MMKLPSTIHLRTNKRIFVKMKGLIILSFLAFGVLSGCFYEVAKPPKIRHVHIASDVLTPSDSRLFKSLKKFKNIHVHIHNLSLDSLNRLIEKEGITTQIDLVIFSSIKDGLKFENKGLLQTIFNEENIPQGLMEHFSPSKKLLGIGYNPYVVIQKRSDSTSVLRYVDLQKNNQWTTCDENQLIPFFAGVKSSFNQQETKLFSKWVERFLDQQTSDSISTTAVSFGRMTDCAATLKRSERIQFPNQELNGSYSDMIVTGVIRQARNYSVVLEVLKTFDYSVFLYSLNKAFNTFPASSNAVNYKGKIISIYPVSPVRLTTLYDPCQSLLLQKKKKKANL